jgi:hypothetical protein
VFYIVQPYADGPDRCQRASVISEHATAAGAFAELERLAERLDRIRRSPARASSSRLGAARDPPRNSATGRESFSEVVDMQVHWLCGKH